MIGRPRISPWSVGGVSFVVTVCMTPVSLGRQVFESAGYGSLLWLTLSFAAAMLGTHLALTFAEAPLRPWADAVRGFLRLPRALFYLLGAAAMLHVWVEILGRTELPGTPRAVSALLTMLIAVYALRLGIANIARVIGLIAILTIVPLYVLAFSAGPSFDFARLLPYPFGVGTIPWLWPTILFAPRGYDILPAFVPHSRGNLRKPVYIGMAFGAFYILLSMVLPQLVFGLTVAKQLTSPFLSMVETITSTYLPFQRIAFLSFILWQMIVFSIVAAYSISGIDSLGVKVYPLTPWSALLPWALGVMLLADLVLPDDIFTLIKNAWSLYGLLLYFIMPALLLTLGRLHPQRREAPA